MSNLARVCIVGVMMGMAAVAFAYPAGEADSVALARPIVYAVRTPGVIRPDGNLSEEVWRTAPAWITFVQRDPNEGKPATERTEVRVAYDDAALYIAARMFDSSPDSIVARLNRKDAQPNSDLFAVYVDSYYDHRSGFYFGLDAGGTYYDGNLSNDEFEDDAWDGVWEGNVQHDAQGWTAEMRIPFSQLRFQQTDVWGINFERDIARKHENVYLAFTPRNGSGFVSRFADLTGIRDVTPPARIAVLPYITGRGEFLRTAAGNPFKDGSDFVPGLGADIKLGLGTNLTLDATVNPDFGQVEVDPAVVNLSDVETYFSEKRPFFLEGSSIFSFGSGGSRNNWGFNWSTPTMFYTRRIGRAPQGSPPSADFADIPSGTRILGAAKLTGKVGDNWSIGTLHAFTAREYADLQTGGVRSRAELEPFTYYGVFRGAKEFSKGAQGLGILATTTARQFQDGELHNLLNQTGSIFGLDGWTFLDSSRVWVITGSAVGSYVHGSKERLLSLQTNSQHYFQRPDAPHLHIDSNATSLGGYYSRVLLNKQKGNVIFNSAFGIVHPGFEINDLGFLSRTDIVNTHVGGGYKWTEPTEWFRNMSMIGAWFRTWDFSGTTVWHGLFYDWDTQYRNYMEVDFSFAYNPETMNNRRTRGGPLTLNPPGYQFDLGVWSDNRQPLVASVSSEIYQSEWTRYLTLATSLEWRPTSNVSLSFGPSLELDREYAQWVSVFDDPLASLTFGRRYIVGVLDQKTLSANIRVNWTFTPTLSLQVFMQPLISSGKYYDFKELRRSRTFDYRVYGTEGSTITANDGTFTVDPDGAGPAPSSAFTDPNFHVVSLRGNAVLRWEFLPGSVMYLVWTQTRSQADENPAFQVDRSLREMMDAPPDNILMVKVSYWWSM